MMIDEILWYSTAGDQKMAYRVRNKGWKSGCPTDNHILKMWLSAWFSGCPHAFAQGGS